MTRASTRLRLALADDHPVYPDGLAWALSARPECEVTASEKTDAPPSRRYCDSEQTSPSST